MGAEGLHQLLSRLNLDELSYSLRHKAGTETSQQRKNEALKRLQVVEAFRASKGVNRPEWMIVKVVPVIPPELRPLVPLDGGRFATSDQIESLRPSKISAIPNVSPATDTRGRSSSRPRRSPSSPWRSQSRRRSFPRRFCPASRERCTASSCSRARSRWST